MCSTLYLTARNAATARACVKSAGGWVVSVVLALISLTSALTVTVERETGLQQTERRELLQGDQLSGLTAT